MKNPAYGPADGVEAHQVASLRQAGVMQWIIALQSQNSHMQSYTVASPPGRSNEFTSTAGFALRRSQRYAPAGKGWAPWDVPGTNAPATILQRRPAHDGFAGPP